MLNRYVGSGEFFWSDLYITICTHTYVHRETALGFHRKILSLYTKADTRKAVIAQGRFCKQKPERADFILPPQADNTRDDGKCRYCKLGATFKRKRGRNKTLFRGAFLFPVGAFHCAPHRHTFTQRDFARPEQEERFFFFFY